MTRWERFWESFALACCFGGIGCGFLLLILAVVFFPTAIAIGILKLCGVF